MESQEGKKEQAPAAGPTGAARRRASTTAEASTKAAANAVDVTPTQIEKYVESSRETHAAIAPVTVKAVRTTTGAMRVEVPEPT